MLHKIRKGQVATTMTWVVATIIIIAVLTISIIVTSNLAVFKSKEGFTTAETADLFAKKSLSGYLLTKNSSGSRVYSQLRKEENFNDFNGELAAGIFEKLYEKEYNHIVFLGILEEDSDSAKNNNYFKDSEISQARKDAALRAAAVYDLVSLDGNKFIQMVLWRQA